MTPCERIRAMRFRVIRRVRILGRVTAACRYRTRWFAPFWVRSPDLNLHTASPVTSFAYGLIIAFIRQPRE